MKNESTEAVTLQPNLKLAELHPVAHITHTEVTSKEETLNPDLLDFGNSPVPPQWKERLQRRLKEWAKVFSLN